MTTDQELENIVQAAGLDTGLMRMGAASCIASEGCAGVTLDDLRKIIDAAHRTASTAAPDSASPEPTSASTEGAASLPDAFWEALQRLIENAVTQGPASMEDARLVGRYRDQLAALAPTGKLPVSHGIAADGETGGGASHG